MANILIIDDDKFIRDWIADVVTRLGHNPVQTHLLREGLVKARSEPFDIVFLDVQMPDGNGLEIMPEIKATRSSPEIIVITGMGDPDEAELAIQTGAWDYLEKPASFEAIKLPVLRALEYRAEREPGKPSMFLKRNGLIGDSQFEGICHELGLKDTIIPSRTISRYLVDMVGGSKNVELTSVIKDGARFFVLIAGEEDAVAAKDLKLPAAAKVICYYRDGKFSHADEDTTFRKGDEVVILTHSKNMPALQERWQPKPAPEESANSAMGQKTGVKE